MDGKTLRKKKGSKEGYKEATAEAYEYKAFRMWDRKKTRSLQTPTFLKSQKSGC